MKPTIQDLAYQVLMESDVDKKIALSYQANELIQTNQCVFNHPNKSNRVDIPGRPNKPNLVLPKQLKKRKMHTEKGIRAFYHAVAHIEFNAINLAWDAVYRFTDMPKQYYLDWAQVGQEESKHFKMLNDYLHDLDSGYGEFDAHNGLWEMAVKTDGSVLERMALVPRVLEARGLDVTPPMLKKLKQLKDERGFALLNIILKEEVDHVRKGNNWYHYLCELESLDSIKTFETLVDKYFMGKIRGPFNREQRLQAGFTVEEMNNLEHISL